MVAALSLELRGYGRKRGLQISGGGDGERRRGVDGRPT